MGKNKQLHVPKGSDPEVPHGTLWLLPPWLPGIGLSWGPGSLSCKDTHAAVQALGPTEGQGHSQQPFLL